MSNIGGVDVDIVQGLPIEKRLRVETWEVPGLDGYGAQTLGNGEGDFDLVTVFYATGASASAANDAANDHIDACIALQGTVITIVDDWGDTYDKYLVVRADPRNSKKPVIYLGAPAVRVEIKWSIICT